MKERLKCKIINITNDNYEYIVINKDYEIVSKGISSSEGWVKNDAGGYHAEEKFDKLFGKKNWEVDFSDMYSNENDKIRKIIDPNIIIEIS